MKKRIRKPAHTAYAVTLMGVMGVSAITPALPEIARAFSISRQEAGLLVVFFTLPGIVFSPVTGVVADRFGRKVVVSIAIFLFGVSGFLCTLVNFRTMLLLRLIQGSSASSLVALSTTIIGDAYEGRERAKIIGYNASILTIGIALYQLSGGYLASLCWKYPFYMFLLAIPVSIFVLLSPLPEVRSEKSFSEYFRKVGSTFNRRMYVLFLTGMIAYAILYGTFLTYLPFAIQSAGGSSVRIGEIQATMSLSTALFAANLTRISDRIKRVIPAGFTAYGISLIGILISYLLKCELCFFIPAVIFGFAQGTVLPTLQHEIVSMTEAEGRAAVMSTYGSVSKLGQTTGPAFFGLFSISGVYEVGSVLAFSIAFLHCLHRSHLNNSQNPHIPHIHRQKNTGGKLSESGTKKKKI